MVAEEADPVAAADASVAPIGDTDTAEGVKPNPVATVPPPVAGGVTSASGAPVGLPVVVPRLGLSGPPRPKALVVGDENFLYTCGLQEAYPAVEFLVASCLARPNLEVYNFDPMPNVLQGRHRYMVDPSKLIRNFQGYQFDALVLFLPGLSFVVPPELGTPDRPLFAFRLHLFVFHVIRHAKGLLKNESKLHLVWPDEAGLMMSPCGAAGIDLSSLISFCGCRPISAEFSHEKVDEGWFMPFIFGDIHQPTPPWLQRVQISSYVLDRQPIPVPLSIALMLHPDISFVSIKDPSPGKEKEPGPMATLREWLLHEAASRRDKLRGIFGPKEEGKEPSEGELVPEASEEDSILVVPTELFLTTFDDLAHIGQILKYQVMEDQPLAAVTYIEMLDPRLPTRVIRPPPSKVPPPLIPGAISGPKGTVVAARKRPRAEQEEWGAMRFFCPLTKIAALTPDKMRLHMQGELYKRIAAMTPGWEGSDEKHTLVALLNEAEELERQAQRAKTVAGVNSGKGIEKGKGKDGKAGKGKFGGKKGGKGKHK